jgi:predicted HAD superfamily Cof-like phosphohydrolase
MNTTALAALLHARNPLADVACFMEAAGQTIHGPNPRQAALYDDLVAEEDRELGEARQAADEAAEADAHMDLIWVLLARCFSRGWPVLDLWAEVARANMSKIDPATGRVTRREDGKILKPAGWRGPDIAGVLARHRSGGGF